MRAMVFWRCGPGPVRRSGIEQMSSHPSVRQERLLDFLSSPADPEWEPGSQTPVPEKLPHQSTVNEKYIQKMPNLSSVIYVIYIYIL